MMPQAKDSTNPGAQVTETARAKLPIPGAEDAIIVSFQDGHTTHLALIIGDIAGSGPVLARVHSACITGDVLGSLRCDCGVQWQISLNTIKKAGRGVLLYLNQEGRGIGITNKLRAYNLQEQGMDTFEANVALGFAEDARDFSVAAAMLKQVGAHSIRLLTNNPHKVEALNQAGIDVRERVPLIAPGNVHSHAYIAAKAKKAGHIF